MTQDTIAAIATPLGQGGVAIVRLSGPEAHAIVARLLERGDRPLAPRQIYVGRLRDQPGGRSLDEVLVFALRAPRSYTGEDTAEIQCHGGSVVTRRVLQAVIEAGARPAAPGEFTRRAFVNGRLDLAQAEAVADLIAARSDAAQRLAWSQLEGHLSARVETLRAALLEARALCEAAIDFPDEDVPELSDARLGIELARVRGEIEALAGTFERTRVRYDGARAVLVGRPNVGKSSVLNALAGRERAIVTPVAGTTRDVLEASVTLRGVPVVLADTAGIRETEDVVERVGVERAHAALVDAGCVLAIFDCSRPLEGADESVAAAVRGRPVIAVLNKRDLPAAIASGDVSALFGAVPIVELSALTGEGLDELEAAIAQVLLAGSDAREEEIGIFCERHRDAARRAALDLTRAEQALSSHAPLELVASDLAAAAEALGSITGVVTSEDVLDRVFAEFCIGK
ncbi:MAG: tRNA uridine-5-carboxymethylaminomethyl(34) synthesis GTPase MnmE [Deltaproteobacteria bacterium]|nr:tRNA uridine-5-carboxymethylaminomethyl(34) synthesis GTPase MnmE [Deltaproteobacteria bacterium]